MTENRINFMLTEDEQKIIEDSFATIKGVLKPHVVVLSETDRKTLPRVADGTLPFIEKVTSYAVTYPQFKPVYMSSEELAIDVNGFKLSNKLLLISSEVHRQLEDISILSGSEAYSSSLSYYRNVKAQALDDQPEAKTVAEELSQRFAGQGKTLPPK